MPNGEIEYVYGNRSDVSRSTSPREILPLLYALAAPSRRRPRRAEIIPLSVGRERGPDIALVPRRAAAARRARLVVEPSSALYPRLFY